MTEMGGAANPGRERNVRTPLRRRGPGPGGSESALLAMIGKSTTPASALLKPLFKHIQMITIIARSARIEAASLDGDREGFLAFTQEAYDLGKAVQGSIEGCARDQQRRSKAVITASIGQKEFEKSYGDQLVAEGAELGPASSTKVPSSRA